MIKGLLEKGYAYQIDGDVYYAVERFAQYGKLSGRSLEDLQAGARVEVDERKKTPMDFALWKTAKEGEPAWESPWGPGRPGWHIECSAMSLKYLGFGFDIHGGGSDLIFPHHENEVAQSEAFADNHPFCHYWLHNGFITVNQEKMSKSLGNFFLIRDILAKFPAPVIRFYLLSTHYRSPLDFDDSKLEMSQRGLERLKTSLDLLDHILGETREIAVHAKSMSEVDIENTREVKGRENWLDLTAQSEQSKRDFIEAMDDDFNTARATAALFDLSRETNSLINVLVRGQGQPDDNERRTLIQARKTMEELLGVLGLEPEFLRSRGLSEDDAAGNKQQRIDQLISLITQLRQEARQQQDWSAADRIRDGLKQTGVALEDTSQGVRVRITRPDSMNQDCIEEAMVEMLIGLRQDARSRKNWVLADQVRDGLFAQGIILEDSPQGTRYKR
jgi:cysteinyl-tRNA synthetase